MSKSKAGPEKRKPGHLRNSVKKTMSVFNTHLVLCSNQVHTVLDLVSNSQIFYKQK